MSKLNHKLVSVILLTTTVMSFSGVIIPVVQAQLPVGSFYNFTRDLTMGSRGDDVKALQQFLNAHGFQVSASGPGSSGNETTYFGRATKEALAQWQASQVADQTGLPASEAGSGLPASLAGRPIRLKIPKIKLDSVVEQVGLTPDGAMDVPKNISDVGWFKLGPRPGDNGTAVIDGHFGFKKGSVFDNLYKLSKGDKLYVQDEKGKITTFVVREILKYDSKADASDVFGSNEGQSHLNLITCEGIWDKVSRNYSKRLVVFTDKE